MPRNHPQLLAVFQVVKHISKDFEINGNFAFEHWNTPTTGVPGLIRAQNTVTTTTIQLMCFRNARSVSSAPLDASLSNCSNLVGEW